MSNKSILFKDGSQFKNYFLKDSEIPLEFLPKTNKINIIIGSNNSGKSYFMRKLMTQKNFFYVDNEILGEYNLLIDEFNSKIREDARFREEYALVNLKLGKMLINQISENRNKLTVRRFNIEHYYVPEFNKLIESITKDITKAKYYFIPTLRTAHSLYEITKEGKPTNQIVQGFPTEFKKIEEDIFLSTIRKYYGLEKDVKVFTGLHLYREILNARNSKRETRNRFTDFEDFVGKSFFNGETIDIVAEFNKEKSLKNENDNENINIHFQNDIETRYLYELGDGIQALIVLMYSIFMADENSFIVIDEPELNLHPGMQRLFLEQINYNEDLRKKNLTYFISTHSNHFLDLTIEKDNISIFSFNSNFHDEIGKKFFINNVNNGDNKLLKDLGVNNSSVFMANCSIWVEGISDRNYIKAFLKAYCDFIGENYPKEDIDFAFFEYAGSNIDHYIFEKEIEKEDEEIIIKDIKSLALSNRIFLLADSDEAKLSSKKGKRLKAFEEAQTDNFIPKILWNLREVENLLTNDIWKEVLMDLCNKTLVKSNEDEIRERIDKALSEINALDFSKKYVGEFLEELRNKLGKISSSYILNQSVYQVKGESFGTIINKRELSELVFNKGFSWEVLSKNKEIENLIIDIYNFITKN